ncbi:MAG: hypothetical protein KC464_07010 [Myxococcales bacterium]|nr:hypothetical protein [Myxococcales bacterium]
MRAPTALLILLAAAGCGEVAATPDPDAGGATADAGPDADAALAPYPGPCVTENDSPTGPPIETRTVYTYDAYDPTGHELSRATDVDADGVPDQITLSTYDAAGNKIRSDEDYDGNGTTDYTSRMTYDADGHVTRYEIDEDGNGTTDWIENDSYVAGFLAMTSLDYDADGTLDFVGTWTRRADGEPTRYERGPGDGTIDQVERWEYQGPDAKISRYELDVGNDGMLDAVTTYAYDLDWTTISYDGDGDGTLDSIVRQRTDAAGHVLEATNDSGADGSIDGRQVYTYDADGNSTSTRTYDGAGTLLAAQLFDWEGGRRVRMRRDNNGDGAFEIQVTWAYDDRGDLVTVERDDGPGGVDGVIDSRLTHDYGCFDGA